MFVTGLPDNTAVLTCAAPGDNNSGTSSLWDKYIVGGMLHSVAGLNFTRFMQLQVQALVQAVVATSANEIILCVQRSIEGELRSNLTDSFMKSFFEENAYFKLSLGDKGAVPIKDAASRVSDDIETFSRAISELASEILKPIVDIVLYTIQLRGLLNVRGQALTLVYLFVGIGVVRQHLPDYAGLAASQAALESEFKQAHARVKRFSESIAFCGKTAGMAIFTLADRTDRALQV